MYSNYPAKASKNATEGYILNIIKGSCKNATGVKTGIKLMNRVVLEEKPAAKVRVLDPKTEKLDPPVAAVKDEEKVVCGLNTN